MVLTNLLCNLHKLDVLGKVSVNGRSSNRMLLSTSVKPKGENNNNNEWLNFIPPTREAGEICSSGCSSKNIVHFLKYRHPHLENFNRNLISETNWNISLQTAEQQLLMVEKVQNLKDKIPHHGNMIDKLNYTHPYNLFFNKTRELDTIGDEMRSICFTDLLDPSLGELESSLHINSRINVPWLLAQYKIMGLENKPLMLVYQNADLDYSYGSLSVVNAPTSNNAKMMVLLYKDKSIRIVVLTANMVQSDWEDRTHGIWVSPKCPLRNHYGWADETSETHFKEDLLIFLQSYKLSKLKPWIHIIAQCNMDAIKVFFISSVPVNKEMNNQRNWGMKKLCDVYYQLNRKDFLVTNSYAIVQSSPMKRTSLQLNYLTFPPFIKSSTTKLVYPIGNNVMSSNQVNVQNNSSHLSNVRSCVMRYGDLCRWKTKRSNALLGLNTVSSVSFDNSKLYYFLLTSATPFAKEAWGDTSVSGFTRINSYEAGIFFNPSKFIDDHYFPLKWRANHNPIFYLPFELPLTRI